MHNEQNYNLSSELKTLELSERKDQKGGERNYDLSSELATLELSERQDQQEGDYPKYEDEYSPDLMTLELSEKNDEDQKGGSDNSEAYEKVFFEMYQKANKYREQAVGGADKKSSMQFVMSLVAILKNNSNAKNLPQKNLVQLAWIVIKENKPNKKVSDFSDGDEKDLVQIAKGNLTGELKILKEKMDEKANQNR